MLKFGGRLSDGSLLLGIGLSAENMRRLQSGQPIYKPLSDWQPGMSGRVLICGGQTEESIEADLMSMMQEHDIPVDRPSSG